MPVKRTKIKKRSRRTQLLIIFSAVFLAVSSYAVFLLPNKILASHISPKRANYYLPWDIPDSKIKELAKWDLLVLDMETQHNSKSALQKIRQLNPHIKILVYITSQEIRKDAATGPSYMRRKFASGIDQNWYLSDPQNNKYTFWQGTWMLNLADNAPEINGLRFNKYLAQFVSNELLSTGLWDGVFYDNAWDGVKWVAEEADLNKDGQVDSDIDLRWSNGMRELFAETRRLTGNKYYLVGNATSDKYRNDLNGIMLESFPQFGWKKAMQIYDSNHNGKLDPRINIVNVNTGNKGSSQNYKKIRFGLASTLLLDGYYSFDFGDKDHGQTWWYDEYDILLGNPTGNALSLGNNQNFEEDVWRRDYERGITIANATPEIKIIDLGGEYEKINGKQDPKINDGSIVSQVSIDSKDGLIMLKTFQLLKNAVYANGDFVRFYDSAGSRTRNGFFAFESIYPAKTKIFNGDINGEIGDEKIVITGNRMNIFNSRGEIWYRDFPFGGNFKGEIDVAVGRVMSGQTNVIAYARNGGKMTLYTHYGAAIKEDFYPFGKKYKDEVNIAAGNIDADKDGEVIISSGKGKKSEIFIFNSKLNKLKRKIKVGDGNDYVRVSVGDVNGDAKNEIAAVISYNGYNIIRFYSGDGKKLGQFKISTAFGGNKMRVGFEDVNLDGKDDVILMSAQ